MFPELDIEVGSKPNRPNDLIKKTLPKTPDMVFPISPNEYFLRKNPVRFAPTIPIKMLNNEIKVGVISKNFINVRNPFHLFFHLKISSV